MQKQNIRCYKNSQNNHTLTNATTSSTKKQRWKLKHATWESLFKIQCCIGYAVDIFYTNPALKLLNSLQRNQFIPVESLFFIEQINNFKIFHLLWISLDSYSSKNQRLTFSYNVRVYGSQDIFANVIVILLFWNFSTLFIDIQIFIIRQSILVKTT